MMDSRRVTIHKVDQKKAIKNINPPKISQMGGAPVWWGEGVMFKDSAT